MPIPDQFNSTLVVSRHRPKRVIKICMKSIRFDFVSCRRLRAHDSFSTRGSSSEELHRPSPMRTHACVASACRR
jgi:hypothetical protein